MCECGAEQGSLKQVLLNEADKPVSHIVSQKLSRVVSALDLSIFLGDNAQWPSAEWWLAWRKQLEPHADSRRMHQMEEEIPVSILGCKQGCDLVQQKRLAGTASAQLNHTANPDW